MDKGLRPVRLGQRPGHTRCQNMPNVNIPVAERLNWYGQFRRREEDNLSRKMMEMFAQGKRRRGRSRRSWINNTRDDMNKYELTADMTDNRQYGRMMVKTGTQRCGDDL